MGVVTAGLIVAGVAAGASAIQAKQQRIAATRAADAAAGAAVAQQGAAGKQFNYLDKESQAISQQALNASKQYNVQELNALDSALAQQQTYVQKQQQLLDAVDPTLMEASKQALSLLGGQKAASLGPLENQRAQQRQALQNSLRSQGLGDGSSAALNALGKFDSETANILGSAQQSSLNTLLGTTVASNPNINASTSNLAAIGQGYGALGARNAQTITNAGAARLGALSGAGTQVINNAGAQYVGDNLKQQAAAAQYGANAQMFGNVAGQAAGYSLGNYFGNNTTNPNTNPNQQNMFSNYSYNLPANNTDYGKMKA